MKHTAARWLIGLAAAAAASNSVAAVDVRFVDSKRFIDATLEGYGDDPERNRVLLELESHLRRLGARCIPDDQSLEIVVREIDLAGDYIWRNRQAAGNFRLLRDANWSRMTIEYAWRAADGSLIAASVDRLQGASYLWGTARLRSWDASLPDEKAMLTDWFEPLFCRGPAGSTQRRGAP